MKNILNTIWEILADIGKARAAVELTHLGRWEEARAIYQD